MKNPIILVSALVLLVLGAGIGLVVVANTMEPPNQPMEHVIPDDTFPQ